MTNTTQFTDTFDDYAETPNPGLDYEAEARQITWAEANRRLAEAAAMIPTLEEQGKITKQARAVLAQAEANENHTRDTYNGLHGTGQAMKASIIKLCAFEGVPIPQDGPPSEAETDHNGSHSEPVDERPMGDPS